MRSACHIDGKPNSVPDSQTEEALYSPSRRAIIEGRTCSSVEVNHLQERILTYAKRPFTPPNRRKAFFLVVWTQTRGQHRTAALQPKDLPSPMLSLEFARFKIPFGGLPSNRVFACATPLLASEVFVVRFRPVTAVLRVIGPPKVQAVVGLVLLCNTPYFLGLFLLAENPLERSPQPCKWHTASAVLRHRLGTNRRPVTSEAAWSP